MRYLSRLAPRPLVAATGSIVVGLGLLGAVLAPTPEAIAQVAAQAVPAKLSLTVAPNTPVQREVTVSNNGTEAVVVTVRYQDWSLSENGDVRLMPGGTLPQSLAKCVSVEPAEFTVGPGEVGGFVATLALPEDEVATRWGVLLSEVRPAVPAAPGEEPTPITELGTTLYLSRAPEGAVEPEVAGLEIAPLPGDSIAVTLSIRNAGARHFVLASHVALRDASGATRNQGRLPTGMVLPGGIRHFTWVAPAGLATGDYTARVTIDAGAPLPLVAERLFRWISIAPAELPVSQADE